MNTDNVTNRVAHPDQSPEEDAGTIRDNYKLISVCKIKSWIAASKEEQTDNNMVDSQDKIKDDFKIGLRVNITNTPGTCLWIQPYILSEPQIRNFKELDQSSPKCDMSVSKYERTGVQD